ncbi:MAG: S-layer protein [Methanoregulaceae archaeon]|nr:S-layer protein [Methanoregulaceae archaeon]
MISHTDKKISRIGAYATLFAVAACMITLMIAVAPARAESDQPTVFIERYTVTPQVLAPGDHGTVAVVIKNTASTATLQESSGIVGGSFTTVKSVDIPTQIEAIGMEGNGITVISETYQRFGSIGPGQSATVTFAIQAPLEEGIYFPEVWVDIYGGRNVRYPLPVNVNAKNQVLRAPAIVVKKSLPDTVNPGDSFPVRLTLENAGTLRANQVILSVNTSSSSIGVKGPGTLVIDELDGGSSQDVTVDFVTDKKAPTGLQKVYLTFDYQLPDGTAKQQRETIEIPVKGRAELGFVSVDTNPPRLVEKTPFDLTIRIENTGSGDAEQVSATIDLPAEGTKEAFIGKIKPGNDAPALFLLEGAKAGTHPYTLTITYTDDMGTHTMTRDMNLRVAATDLSGTIILVVVILGILGVVAYRYWHLPRINGDGKFPWVKKN